MSQVLVDTMVFVKIKTFFRVMPRAISRTFSNCMPTVFCIYFFLKEKLINVGSFPYPDSKNPARHFFSQRIKNQSSVSPTTMW